MFKKGDKLDGCEKHTVYLCVYSFTECKYYDPVESLFSSFKKCKHLDQGCEPFECTHETARKKADIQALKSELERLEQT